MPGRLHFGIQRDVAHLSEGQQLSGNARRQFNHVVIEIPEFPSDVDAVAVKQSIEPAANRATELNDHFDNFVSAALGATHFGAQIGRELVAGSWRALSAGLLRNENA